jgi:hypothetical protein
LRLTKKAPSGAFLFGWRRGRDYSRPALAPAGSPPTAALCAAAPLVEPHQLSIEGSNPPAQKSIEKGAQGPFFYGWRRGRDSNPRYGITVYTLSRRAPSTTRTPLQIFVLRYSRCSLRSGLFGPAALTPAGPPSLRDDVLSRPRRSSRTLDTVLPYTHFPGVPVTTGIHALHPAGRRRHAPPLRIAPGGPLNHSDTSPGKSGAQG